MNAGVGAWALGYVEPRNTAPQTRSQPDTDREEQVIRHSIYKVVNVRSWPVTFDMCFDRVDTRWNNVPEDASGKKVDWDKEDDEYFILTCDFEG